MDTIKQTVDKMNEAFEGFKGTFDARLKAMERQGVEEKRPSYDMKDGKTALDEETHKEAFFHYIRKGDDSKLLALETKGLTSGTPEDGGHFIPTAVSDRIKLTVDGLCPLRELANTITISTGAVEVLLDENTAEVGWIGETGKRKETGTPKLHKIKIPVHELYARPRASQRLLDDSKTDIETWLSAKISAKMAQLENIAFIHGDGRDKPKGFLAYESLPKEKVEKNKFEHIELDNVQIFNSEKGFDVLIDLMNSLNPIYHHNAVWVMSRSMHAMVRKIRDQTGQFLWQPGLGEKACPTLLGYKVVVMEGMPEVTGDKPIVPLVFGNFKEAYQIVERADTQILRDPYSSKPYVEFYTTRRVGGDVVKFDALKMLKIKG